MRKEERGKRKCATLARAEGMREEKECSRVLHCLAFGDLRPADICEECENCERNAKFADNGGRPAMLLTGSRENLANALRAPGVAMNDVVVVNAGLYDEMCDFIETFTTIAGQTVLLMGADNAREIYDKAVEISGKSRGEK